MLTKFDGYDPQLGQQLQVGKIKISDFRQITQKQYKIDS